MKKAKLPTIKLHPVVSSNILGAGWDPVTSTLAIRFGNGSVYHYEGISKETYESMWQAESIGKFVNQNIAKKFKFKKVK